MAMLKYGISEMNGREVEGLEGWRQGTERVMWLGRNNGNNNHINTISYNTHTYVNYLWTIGCWWGNQLDPRSTFACTHACTLDIGLVFKCASVACRLSKIKVMGILQVLWFVSAGWITVCLYVACVFQDNWSCCVCFACSAEAPHLRCLCVALDLYELQSLDYCVASGKEHRCCCAINFACGRQGISCVASAQQARYEQSCTLFVLHCLLRTAVVVLVFWFGYKQLRCCCSLESVLYVTVAFNCSANPIAIYSWGIICNCMDGVALLRASRAGIICWLDLWYDCGGCIRTRLSTLIILWWFRSVSGVGLSWGVACW